MGSAGDQHTLLFRGETPTLARRRSPSRDPRPRFDGLRRWALLAALATGCWLRPIDAWAPRADATAEDVAAERADVVAEDVAAERADVDADAPCAPDAALCGGACCEGPCADGVCERPVGGDANHAATCVWTERGAAWCWGTGGFFATAVNDQLRPAPLPSLGAPVAEVALGVYQASCARTRTGGLSCWNNQHNSGPRAPRAATGAPADVRRVVAGDLHTCVLDGMGSVWCTGGNYYGELGRGASALARDYSDFARVRVSETADLTGVVELAADGAHTCAWRQDGTVWCWGSDEYCQLGGGAQAPAACGEPGALLPCSRVARPVSGLSLGTTAPGAQALAVGNHFSCVRQASGAVSCWGRADPFGFSPFPSPWPEGTFPLCGNAPCACAPRVVPGVSDATRVVVGRAYTCVTRAATTPPVACWGAEHSGIEPMTAVGGPVAALVAGANHACAIAASGAVTCWGDGSQGQIAWPGTHRSAAVAVSGLAGVTTAAAGYDFTCALGPMGAAQCWGRNHARQLGDGTHNDSGRPVAVLDLTGATQVSAGFDHACARRADGTLWCWGYNADGQLGPSPDEVEDPHVVGADGDAGAAPLGEVRAVHAGSGTTCALRGGADGGVGVECWGRNEACQAAQGFPDGGVAECRPGSHAPRARVVLPFEAAAELAMTHRHGCAREAADGGAVACWGENYIGQANPMRVPPGPWTPPARIALAGAATSVSAGSYSSCAVVAGAVFCWGNTARPSAPPRMVVASGAASVHSGADFDCARMADGSVRCWGENGRGQLGDGTRTASATPVAVQRAEGGRMTPLDNVRELTASAYHACAVRTDGSLWCWGSDLCGELGQGNTCRLQGPTRVVW